VSGSSPTLLRRYVALELRRLRETAGLSPTEVARLLPCNKSHLTHIETARNLPRLMEIRVLFPLYGVADRTEDFVVLVDAARKGKDWWKPFEGAAPEWFNLYLAQESSAATIETYEAMCVPGLAHTRAYARDIIQIGEPDLAPAEVERRIELRIARQDVVHRRPDAPLVHSILDESALYRAASADVLVEQLDRLLKFSELPNVTIQVLPFSRSLVAGMNGPFHVLTFRPELVGDPGVVYVEDRVRGLYYEQPVDIQRCRSTLYRLGTEALSTMESTARIARRIVEIKEHGV
jgi:hypothetical protein